MLKDLFKKRDEPKNVDLVIVGLGNPGNKYIETRHNVGWMAVERIAKKLKTTFQAGRGDYYSAFAKFAGKLIMLVLPTTYMNNSGKALSQISKKYSVPSKDFLVLVDEYNFPVGKIHIKTGGSGGGHNGTSSVIEHIGNDFMRMRLGIDRNFSEGGLVDYVLSNFDDPELEDVNKMLDNVVLSSLFLAKAGFKRAISEINSGKLFEKIDPK